MFHKILFGRHVIKLYFSYAFFPFQEKEEKYEVVSTYVVDRKTEIR